MEYRMRIAEQDLKIKEKVEFLYSSENKVSKKSSGDKDCEEEIPENPRKKPRVNAILPAVATALDRTNLSNRKAVFVLTAAAQSLENDVCDLNINRSSIQ